MRQRPISDIAGAVTNEVCASPVSPAKLTIGTGSGIPTFGKPSDSGAIPSRSRFPAVMCRRSLPETLASIVPERENPLVEGLFPVAKMFPGLPAQPEVDGASGRVDRLDRSIRGPAQSSRVFQRTNGLCQRDLSPQRRVHDVREQIVAELTPSADSPEISLAVNERAAVPRATSR